MMTKPRITTPLKVSRASASISSRCPTPCMITAKTQRMWDFTIRCLKNPTCDHVDMNLVKRVVWERTFTPHSMYDRSKNPTYVGFYDSVFEKPDMWRRGLEFSEASGLGKDVYAPLHV
ncbi:hypothetical protein TNCV_1699171 [Trichonephila clavipes]|nr:hypothetical protein TNCV_1699171 [Trichonephila clavipes]